jgi:hypothetical protein
MDYDNKKCDACAVNTLSLFDPPSVQTVMNGFRIIRILGNGGSELKEVTTIEFTFPIVETPTYYDLTDTKLYLDISTLTSAGISPLTGPVPGCCVNLP